MTSCVEESEALTALACIDTATGLVFDLEAAPSAAPGRPVHALVNVPSSPGVVFVGTANEDDVPALERMMAGLAIRLGSRG